MTLAYGNDVSCSTSTYAPIDIAQGDLPPEPAPCVAQRSAPFALQALFNLILYSMVRVYMTIGTPAASTLVCIDALTSD